jgi:microcompartment protein CcmL/EutN
VHVYKEHKQINQDNIVTKGSTALVFSHYVIYIPKEELQDVFFTNKSESSKVERMYSEEEVKQILDATLIEYSDFVLADIPHWFEQFKKK